MPLSSRAFSHARGHLRVSRVFLDGLRKKKRLLVVYVNSAPSLFLVGKLSFSKENMILIKFIE